MFIKLLEKEKLFMIDYKIKKVEEMTIDEWQKAPEIWNIIKDDLDKDSHLKHLIVYLQKLLKEVYLQLIFHNIILLNHIYNKGLIYHLVSVHLTNTTQQEKLKI